MADSRAPSELLAETAKLAERYFGQQREFDEASARPPRLGDVYVLEATRDYAVEWVLVTQDPAEPERFLAVPADGNFLVGSADVALPEDEPVGALKLRCRFGVWVAAANLDPRGRVGVVRSGELAQARQRWLDLGNDGVTGTVVEREVDDDPEYQEWVECVLIPAREALLGARESERKQEKASKDVAGPPVVRRFPVYLIAASILVAAVGGLAAMQLWHQHVRIAELDRRLEEVWGAANVVNPVIALLEPPQVAARGKVKVVLRPEASHVVFFLTLRERSPASRYRLVLREKGNDEPVWMNDRLMLEKPGEIRVGVPAGIFKAGEYELVLSGLEDGEVRRVGEYELEVHVE